MTELLKILRAYWRRYWHCLAAAADITNFDDHRMVTWTQAGGPVKISCQCGKVFYEKKNQK